MGNVRVEVFPWLSSAFNARSSERFIFEEEVEQEATVGLLLKRLASAYKAFGELAFDPASGKLSEHIVVVLNDRLLELLNGLETPLNNGDNLLLLPAFDGGSQDLGGESARKRG